MDEPVMYTSLPRERMLELWKESTELMDHIDLLLKEHYGQRGIDYWYGIDKRRIENR